MSEKKIGMYEGIQPLVNAQVEVNRAVWAANEHSVKDAKSLGWNEELRKQYLIECSRNAIKELSNFLKEAENTLF